ncbi:MAG: CoA transferase [Vulcanimicrobiaceae bacterium]
MSNTKLHPVRAASGGVVHGMDAPSPWQPLSGCRVAALVTNIPGPLAAAELARLGAEVIKIEPPLGDALETAAPRWYAQLVAGMRVLKLDVKRSRSTLLAELIRADVLLTSMRPKALTAAGLQWDELHAASPRLCHIAIVGEAGCADRAGHDLTYQARAGLLEPPAMPRSLFADLFAAQRATQIVAAALYDRERTGTGTYHEVAIADGAAQLSDPVRYGLTGDSGSLGGALPVYRLYRSADGWIALAALEPHFRGRLLEALCLETLDVQALESRFAERSSTHWEEVAQHYDLPLAPVCVLGSA